MEKPTLSPVLVLSVLLAAGCAAGGRQPATRAGAPSPTVVETENRYFYFFEAQLQQRSGNLDQAVILLRKAIALDPGSVYLQKELVFLHLQMRKEEEAAELIDRLLQVSPEDADILALHARSLQRNGRFDEAKETYERVLRIDPQRRNIYLVLGGLYVQTDELDAAADVFERMVAEFPDAYAGYLFLGKIMMEKGDTEAAEGYLQKAVELEDGTLEPRFELLRLYRSQAESFEEVTVKKNDSIAAISLRVYGKYNGDIEQAILKYNPGLKSVNAVREGQKLRFPGIGMIEEDEEARRLKTKIIDQYREILKERPMDVRASLELAEYYLLNGFEADADLLLRDLGERSLEDSEVLGTVVGLYLDRKNYADAARILEGMLAGAPQSSDLHNAAGIAYYGMKENDQAIGHFRKVQPDSRFHGDATIYAAFLYQESGRPEEGIRLLRDAVGKFPQQADFVYYLAVFLEEAEDLAEAGQVLRGGIADHPDNVKMHFRLGVIVDKLGDKEACIEQMKRVIALDPKHANALNYLGYTYAELGRDLDEAESLVKRALSHMPDDGYITDSLGWVHYKKGNYHQALTHLKKAVELVPDDPVILEHLGDTYLKLGDRESAVKFYRLSLEKEHKEKEKIEAKIRELTGAR